MAHAADTSVAVPCLRDTHEFHEVARTAVVRYSPALAGHARFETYAQLTRERVSPGIAVAAIAHNFGEALWLTVEGAERVYGLLERGGIVGGAVYDALVAQAALDHERTLLTFDRRAERTYQRVGAAYELLR